MNWMIAHKPLVSRIMVIMICTGAVLLMSDGKARAQEVVVKLSGDAVVGIDSVAVGKPFSIELWMESGGAQKGLSLGFELYGTDGLRRINHGWSSHSEKLDNESTSGIMTLNGFGSESFWGWSKLQLKVTSWDGILPDRLKVSGIIIQKDWYWQNTKLTHYLSLAIRADEAGILCIDSASVPPTGEWVFASEEKSFAPSWNGPYCITVVGEESGVDTNRRLLESEVRTAFDAHYLVRRISLEDNDLWLSIELDGKTWSNPNDTRALIDSVIVLVEGRVPLTIRSVPFKVYIDEPRSGLPVAEIDVSLERRTSLKYHYSENRADGKQRVYGANVRNTPKKSTDSPTRNIKWKNPGGTLWSGVKLFYGAGPQKRFVGRVVCFTGGAFSSNREVWVEYPSGSVEPKSRSAIINRNDNWYMDANDPAIASQIYSECN